MIKVHSFYSDLLLSLRYLFDNIVFGQGFIKTYEFNVGNRTLQLDYKSQYELPSCLINYQDSNPSQYHPWLLLRNGLGNQSKFPILYDKTKNLSLELQEEMYDINVSVTFNFESQYSAIEAEHRLKSNMPLDKPLQIYHFYTFYEIPDQFLTSEIFDVNNDQIINLYMKHDPLTDRVIHCASVRYEPMQVMNSCQTTLSSSEQRSFGVECTFRFMIPVPIFMQIPGHERPKIRDATTISEYNVAVPVNENVTILKLIIDLTTGEKIKRYVPIYPVDNKFEQAFVLDYNGKSYECSISGVLSGVRQSIGTIKMTVGKSMEDIECSYRLIEQDALSTKSISIAGPVNGHITNFKISNNKITGLLHGVFNNNDHDNNSIINYQISGEYIPISQVVEIDKNPQLVITGFNDIYNYNTSSIIFGPIHSNMPHINTNRVDFSPENSKIIGAVIVEKDTKKCFTTAASDQLDKYGNFQVTIDHKHSVRKIPIYASVKGKVHPKTLYLRYDFIDEQSDCDVEVVALLFDFDFKSVPKYGAQLIERIDLNIIADSFEPIVVGINTKFFEDEFNRIQKENDKVNLKTFVITPSIKDDVFSVKGDDVILTVWFDKEDDIDRIYNKSNRIEWKFTFNEQFYENTGKLIELKEKTDSTPTNALQFKIDHDLYIDEFVQFSVSNPIFFQLYEKF